MRCKKCIMGDNLPSLDFDEKGICTYCNIHESLELAFPFDGKEKDRFERIVEKVKEAGVGRKYDCVMGISGGCDSSYSLHLLKEVYDLRVLAINFDNTWGTDIAAENISNVVTKLDIDLYTHVCGNKEFNDICLSFLEASVPDADIATDLAIAKLYLMAMEKFDIQYSFEGHSFRTEGTVPFGWTYMDGKYIKSVHKKFGKIDMQTYPLLDLEYWLNQVKKNKEDRIRLLYYHKYNKEDIKQFLEKRYDWRWYGGHHHENEWTKFVKSYLLPNKFGIDKRIVEYSALVRSGQISRTDALKVLEIPEELDSDFLSYVIKRLGISQKDFDRLMSLPIKSYKDYETYVPYFKKNIKRFEKLHDEGKIPSTFFNKISLL